MTQIQRSFDTKLFINRTENPAFAREMAEWMDTGRIMPFCRLFHETEKGAILDEQKLTRDIIQFSFILSDVSGKMLLTNRKELQSEARRGHTITKGASMLVGWSPWKSPPSHPWPLSEEDVLWAFNQEVDDSQALTHARRDLNFLGLVRNVRNGIRYYFYVFNVAYSVNDPFIPPLKKDHDDIVRGFHEINEALINGILDKKADLRALQLFSPQLDLDGIDWGESTAIVYNPANLPPFLETIPSVFISHATADDKMVGEIATHLEKAGITHWADHITLNPGDGWSKEVEAAIKYGGCFLLLCSEASLNAPGVMKEQKAALDRRRRDHNYPMIPVALGGNTCEELIPEEFRQEVWALDLRDETQRSNKLMELSERIKAVLSSRTTDPSVV